MLRYPVVLLPALGSDRRLWQPVAERLGDVAEVTVPALAGSSVATIADGVLRDAPERFHLAGLSMGGYVALEIAARQTGRPVSLTLLNTSAREAPADRREGARRLIELVDSGRFDAAVEQISAAVATPGREEAAAVARAMARDLGPDVFRDQQRAVHDRPDRRAELSRLDLPTLVVGGTADPVTPVELAVELADKIPGAQLATIDGCGHLSPLEEPDEVARILRSWLSRADAGVTEGAVGSGA